mmetsp:Transcript_12278/g.30959  ORF Transcript_12278/g.30959 Transcript_12278/m.30959 type:complete len:676 (+) Transcript_12278:161-2188(+)
MPSSFARRAAWSTCCSVGRRPPGPAESALEDTPSHRPCACSGQLLQCGTSAQRVWPKLTKSGWSGCQCSRGSHASSSFRTFSTVETLLQPSRPQMRCTCELTAIPCTSPHASCVKRCATFGPTPGSAETSASPRGVSPPCASTTSAAHSRTYLALLFGNWTPAPARALSISESGRAKIASAHSPSGPAQSARSRENPDAVTSRLWRGERRSATSVWKRKIRGGADLSPSELSSPSVALSCSIAASCSRQRAGGSGGGAGVFTLRGARLGEEAGCRGWGVVAAAGWAAAALGVEGASAAAGREAGSAGGRSADFSCDFSCAAPEGCGCAGGGCCCSPTVSCCNPVLACCSSLAACRPVGVACCGARAVTACAVAATTCALRQTHAQSTGLPPGCAARNSLALLKGALPKKPRYADKGLGWAAVSSRCELGEPGFPARASHEPGRVTSAAFFCAAPPQSTKTIPRRRSASARTAASVSRSHPMSLWLRGEPSRTVSSVLSRRTPSSHQQLREEDAGTGGRPRSELSSVRMLRSDGGAGTPAGTEKLSPFACPCRWYGSCPRMTTRTLSNGVREKAQKTSSAGGKTAPASRSAATRASSSANQSALSSGASASAHEGAMASRHGRTALIFDELRAGARRSAPMRASRPTCTATQSSARALIACGECSSGREPRSTHAA